MTKQEKKYISKDGEFVSFHVDEKYFYIVTGRGNAWDTKNKFSIGQIKQVALDLLDLSEQSGLDSSSSWSKIDSKEKFKALQVLLDSLSPEETEKLKQGDWKGKQIAEYIAENEKPEYVDTKPEVLARLREKFGQEWFATRDTYPIFPGWSKQRSRDWISRLQRQGYLNKREAEHPDSQVRQEYRLGEKGWGYLTRHMD